VNNPAGTALFGDGQYSAGANKFMRAPWANPGDAGFVGRFAGTQGYRHLGNTNVAFCDGHAEAWGELYTETYPADKAGIAPGTGFLSPDNSLYDLE
jgi:prepilin-type processing-associated H-X9-DG protein